MPGVEHIPAIRGLQPRTLVDVGANKGQFSLVARRLFPEISIHAFEPIAAERAKLSLVLKNERLTIYPVAVGRQAETREFFVTSRPDSSSLLKPAVGQKEAFDVSLVSVNSIEVVRLADVIKLAELPRPVLLKIDVQGGELDALIGAGADIVHIDHIYCEVSFVPLYEGQPLAGDIICYLCERGFSVGGVFNQAVTDAFGPTQADVLFHRT
jgi:FkbM family methyltransferase